MFEKEYLRELYEEGKTTNKKYRFQKTIIKKYKQTIDKLRAARRIEDLFLLRSLNYEKLIGKKNSLESVRVDKISYRVLYDNRRRRAKYYNNLFNRRIK